MANAQMDLVEKQCSRCGEIKVLSQFSKDKQHWSGHKSACKLCAAEDFQRWKKNNPVKSKESYRKAAYKKMYGLSDEEAEALVKNRVGTCRICGNVDKLVVDHCHNTKKVRGLICQHCNSMLGYSKDNKKTLQNAIKYLEDFYG